MTRNLLGMIGLAADSRLHRQGDPSLRSAVLKFIVVMSKKAKKPQYYCIFMHFTIDIKWRIRYTIIKEIIIEDGV